MALNSTEQALLTYTDDQAFEHLCCALLVEEYGSIVPLGGTKDEGRDAIAKLSAFQTEDQAVIFMFSLEKTWPAKVRRDQRTIRDNGFKPTLCVFVTSQHVTSTQRKKEIDYAKSEFDWDLDIRDVKWLQTRLESPKYVRLRRQYLGLDELSLPVLLSVGEYSERRLDRDVAPEMPTLLGRDDELTQLLEFLTGDKPALFLSARPGIGKTRILLELGRAENLPSGIHVRFLRTEQDDLSKIAFELDPNLHYLLILEEADRFSSLNPLVELLKMPEFHGKVKTILSVHPWSLDQLQGKLIRFAVESRVLNLTTLSNPVINELLEAQLEVTHNEARRLIIQAAEGNALIAVIAAGVWLKGGSFADITKDEVLRAYFRDKLANAFKAAPELSEKGYLALAIMSATRGLAVERGEVRATLAAAVGSSEGELDVLIEHLESSNLIRHGWSAIRVFPEILVRHVVWDAFFSDHRKHDFREKVIVPFFPIHSENIMQTLAEAEALGATRAAPMLDRFIEEALDALAGLDAQGVHKVLQWFKSFAYYRPLHAFRIVSSVLDLSLQAASARIAGWGEFTITSADILRDCTEVLKEISYRPEDHIIREVLRLLYRIAETQDHSAANQFPDGDSLRVLTEHVLPLKPGKSWVFPEIGAGELQQWLDGGPNERQQEVILECLGTLLSVSWETIESSVVERNVVTLSQGLFAIDQHIKDFHKQLLPSLYKLYELGASKIRVGLIEKISHIISPYSQGGIPDESREYLNELGSTIFAEIYQRSQPGWLAERWALSRELLDRHRRGNLTALPDFYSALKTPNASAFGHLLEWPGRIYEDEIDPHDWRKADALHTAFWEERVGVFLEESTGIAKLLTELNQMSVLALEAKPDSENAVQQNLNLVARILGKQANASALLQEAIARLPSLTGVMRRASVHFLTGLISCDLTAARPIIMAWVEGTDTDLKKAACLAIKAIPVESIIEADTDVVETLVAANQPELDFILVSWFWSPFPSLIQAFPDRTAEALKTIANRADSSILRQIVELLDDSYSTVDLNHLPSLPDDALKEIASQLVRLETVDVDSWHFEGFLARLFRVDPSAWLMFWEKRIQREKELSGSGRYWAAPFHTTKDISYVSISPRSHEVLGTLLEWSARDDWAYSHNGASLFQQHSHSDQDVTGQILTDWIDTNDIDKQRAVARVLERIGYGPVFLSFAKDLLNKTSDSLTIAYLRQTVGSTGVVSGSFIPLYESRRRDFQSWLDDPTTPLGPRLFAEEQIRFLDLDIARERRRTNDD